MSTATERLQQTITVLRSRLADERGVYTRYKKELELYYPKEWAIAGPAIVAVAQYYHGEIVRAKHDLADWMQGHEVHGTYGDSDCVEMVHDTLKELGPLLDAASKAAADYNKETENPMNAATAKMDAESALGEANAAVEMLQDMKKALEEICYAER